MRASLMLAMGQLWLQFTPSAVRAACGKICIVKSCMLQVGCGTLAELHSVVLSVLSLSCINSAASRQAPAHVDFACTGRRRALIICLAASRVSGSVGFV